MCIDMLKELVPHATAATVSISVFYYGFLMLLALIIFCKQTTNSLFITFVINLSRYDFNAKQNKLIFFNISYGYFYFI